MTKKRFWTEQEIEFLKENYRKLPAIEVAKILNRKVRDIFQKTHRLNLEGKRHWTEEEIKVLRDTIHLTSKETAKLLNRSVGSVDAKRFELGIIKTNINFKITKLGEKNPQWKGDNVKNNALHAWIRRHKPKPEFCENCKKVPPFDLANISQEYHRDINDFKWLCRSCHMEEDGRIIKLRLNWKPRPIKNITLICENCKKSFQVIPCLKNKRKTCSNKCLGELKSKMKLFYGNQFIDKDWRKKC